jgi:hypothetical protein
MPSRSKTQSLADAPVGAVDAGEMDADAGGEMESRGSWSAGWSDKSRDEDDTSMMKKKGCKTKKGWLSWGKDADGKPRGWGYASMYLWFIVAPVVIWIILFTVKAPFVVDNVGGVITINNQKLMLWTLIGSIVAWILIYGIYYCRY